jgi:hypothetical protein
LRPLVSGGVGFGERSAGRGGAVGIRANGVDGGDGRVVPLPRRLPFDI